MTTPPRPTKADRRDDARAAALKLKEDQQRAARRQRTLAIGLLVAGLAVVGVVVAVILSSASGGSSGSAQVQPSVSSDRGGVVFDADGVVPPTDGAAPVPGSFGDGVVIVSVYSDFMCPICGAFESLNGPVLDELRAAGEIVVDYHPVSILDRYSQGTAYSTRAAQAVFVVAEEAPDQFVAFSELLFANQPAENTEGLTDAQIADFATQAGVPDDVVATFEDGTFTWWVAQATDAASQDLAQLATPTILLDGVQTSVDWRTEGALAAAIEDARG